MERLRLGIVGIGNMGSLHVQDLSENKVPNCYVTAVCDINPERLTWAKDWTKNYNPDLKTFENYKDMFADGCIDAVLIATPHYLHPVIGIDAFNAGLHVLSEKPAGVYTKQVEEFMEVARKSGKTFGIMLNQRTEPYYQKIREIVRSGELGELKRCVWIITNWYRTQDYYNSGGWRATYAGEGGGVLINQCPHNLDLWQWIYGMPKRIRAFAYNGKYHDIEVEDEVTAYAEYENGSTGVFITTTGEFPGTNRLEISGSLGKLVYENGKLMMTRLSQDERKYCYEAKDGFGKIEATTEEIIPTGVGKGHRQIIQNFTDNILSGTPLLAPGYDGIYSLSISNAMILSSWTNDWVELPNDGEKYWAMLQERIKTSKVKKNVVSKIANLEGTYNSK